MHGKGFISGRKMNTTGCEVILNRYAYESRGRSSTEFANVINIALIASFMSSLRLLSEQVISFIH